MPTPMPTIDIRFSVKMLTVVCAAMIETTPKAIRSDTIAMARGIPAATSDPNTTSRITRVMGKAIIPVSLSNHSGRGRGPSR